MALLPGYLHGAAAYLHDTVAIVLFVSTRDTQRQDVSMRLHGHEGLSSGSRGGVRRVHTAGADVDDI